ncbi:hypothetical protein D779_4048 [Imhoffiella purpurea]|uniref:Uncharacterized protein n=1 Tax=Imhoffiella purpurea TaxID=1249627 RepID=W9VQA1_9GAMM|nr:hypothetical protein D779_4048 [Imhoffiella purpurea]
MRQDDVIDDLRVCPPLRRKGDRGPPAHPLSVEKGRVWPMYMRYVIVMAGRTRSNSDAVHQH